jgi:large conductance mechanosensitive channel
MMKEFKEFVLRGNVLDMAVGIIIGAAFGAIVSSLVADVLMPPIGLALGSVDFQNLFVVLKNGAAAAGSYATLAEAQKAGAVTLNYGLFLNRVISFLIVAFCVFLVVKSVNQMKRLAEKPSTAAEATTKECPHCCSTIAIKATRCPQCTSALEA